jgi:hypothetical protein
MLEALHYRMVYSVRSKAPPKKTPFEIIPNETNHTIPDMFTRNRPANVGDGAADTAEIGNADGTVMPIRGHDQES